MMYWNRLLSAERLGKEGNEKLKDEDYARSQFQRDYDRIIFSSPFRRLQNKTQVFPLPGSVFVHNRLTHSLEVASVGRSLGTMLGNQLRRENSAKDCPYLSEIGNIISAACLAHDLGNPSFGHSGEKAISRYFTDGDGIRYKHLMNAGQWEDLIRFEGNANAFRILTHIFYGKNESQFALTYSTLAAMVKYPCESTGGDKAHVFTKKYGFFNSEKTDFSTIAEKLGLICLQTSPLICYRHPLAFLVEAADDICYYIIDLEDAHRLNILNEAEVKDLLIMLLGNNVEDTFKRLNEIHDSNDKISFLRAKCINHLIQECSQIFWQRLPEIMKGSFNESIMDSLPPSLETPLQEIKKISQDRIYNSKPVVEKEIAGYKIMSGLLEEFVPAVMGDATHYFDKLRMLIPSQFNASDTSYYSRIQSVLDFVSGMTDLYAVELFRKIKGISFPGV